MELHRPAGGDIRIGVQVRITELLSPRTYHAVLPNGKVILLFESSLEPPASPRSVGDELLAGLSLCDFSVGVIVDEHSGYVPALHQHS
jgi:hypothetical protein